MVVGEGVEIDCLEEADLVLRMVEEGVFVAEEALAIFLLFGGVHAKSAVHVSLNNAVC